jgi:ankyrin repeat protein
MKKVFSFVKGKRDERREGKMNPTISVEITNPSGQKITSDDEHIIGLQQGYGYNIDLNGKDKGMPKLHKSVWLGNIEKVKAHAKKTDINLVDNLNRTPLHLAVAQGLTEIAWFLLNNNASMDICDGEGLSPFLKV